MSKLLSANMNRLFKSKVFWLTAATMLALTSFAMIMSCSSNIRIGVESHFEDEYFSTLPHFGLYISVFTTFFIGTEYSDFTIRNKIIVGNNRFEIFFANLITCVAAAGIFFVVWAVSGCVGIAYFGIENIAFGVCLSKLAVGLFTVISVTAILSVLAQLISSKSIGAIAAVFTAFALLLAGSFFYNSLTEPPTTFSYVMISAENGVEFGDEVPNPAYVGGAMRTVYEIMLRVIPMGQQILLADEPLEQPAVMIAISVAVTIIVSVIGYLLFRKKDLR